MDQNTNVLKLLFEFSECDLRRYDCFCFWNTAAFCRHQQPFYKRAVRVCSRRQTLIANVSCTNVFLTLERHLYYEQQSRYRYTYSAVMDLRCHFVATSYDSKDCLFMLSFTLSFSLDIRTMWTGWKESKGLTRMMRGPKDLSYEGRLRKLVLFSLEMRRLGGDFITMHKYIEGGNEEERDSIFTAKW